MINQIIVCNKNGNRFFVDSPDTPLSKGQCRRMERETVINFNDLEKEAKIFTVNKSFMGYLERLAQLNPTECVKYIDNQFNGTGYLVPKKWVTIKPPQKISKEQMKARRKTAAKARMQKTLYR